MSDATKVKQVDNQHAALELALEDIFGIPDGTEIAPSIFGSVNSDGSIGGTPRLKTAGQTSDVDLAAGFEFNDGTKRKKIAYINSVLTIQEYIDGAWVQIASLEQAGTGTLQACTDTEIPTLTSGQFLQVNAGGLKFELVAPASVTGISSIAELDELSANYPYAPAPGYQAFNPALISATPAGDVGGLLYVAGANEIGVIAPPSGVGDPSVIAVTASKTAYQQKTPSVSKWFESPKGDYCKVSDWADVVSGGIAGYVQAATFSTLSYDWGNVTVTLPNGYITLNAGIYNCQFQYYRDGGNPRGVRSWKINEAVPGTIYGPAKYGVVRAALTRVSAEGAITAPSAAIRDLGANTLFVPADATKIYVEVQQDSGEGFSDVDFTLVIYKVK